MTQEEAIKELREMQEGSDEELLHSNADNILLKRLITLGDDEVAEEFVRARKRVGFWYA